MNGKGDSSSEDGGNIKKELVKAGFEIIKKAYDDALQPIAKETGKALGTLGKTINMALSPLRGLVWSWEQIEGYVSEAVERKLKERKVPEERITTPDPDVAVPALEALRYSKLRENYANLLATSMDSAVAKEAHPAFVEILKQLTPDEVRILDFLPNVGRHEPLVDLAYTVSKAKGQFTVVRHVCTLGTDAKFDYFEMVPKYVDNLCRLGLTEIPAMTWLAEEFRYDRIKQLEIVRTAEKKIPEGSTFEFILKMFGLTVLGDSFRAACVTEPRNEKEA
jgi:hypothetical protein